MREFFNLIGALLLALIVILGLGWIIAGNDFFLYKYFAPKQEAVRRQVFEQTKSYNEGKAQDLARYFHEYNQADEEGKKEIMSVVRHQFADYDTDSIKDEQLRSFLEKSRL